MSGAACPGGCCVEARPPVETAGHLIRSDWVGRQLWGSMPLCTILAKDHRGLASAELGAPVSHFGQASAIALFWSFGRELGILFFHELSSLLFLHG